MLVDISEETVQNNPAEKQQDLDRALEVRHSCAHVCVHVCVRVYVFLTFNHALVYYNREVSLWLVSKECCLLINYVAENLSYSHIIFYMCAQHKI